MVAWAERLLYLGLISFGLGLVLRLMGYHDANGFLQGIVLSNGITPSAFLRAGATLALFAASMAVIDLAKRTPPDNPS